MNKMSKLKIRQEDRIIIYN